MRRERATRVENQASVNGVAPPVAAAGRLDRSGVVSPVTVWDTSRRIVPDVEP